MEETDRCFLYPIADNTVAVLIGCLKTNGLLKNDKFENWLEDLRRLTAHIRRIYQFFWITYSKSKKQIVAGEKSMSLSELLDQCAEESF